MTPQKTDEEIASGVETMMASIGLTKDANGEIVSSDTNASTPEPQAEVTPTPDPEPTPTPEKEPEPEATPDPTPAVEPDPDIPATDDTKTEKVVVPHAYRRAALHQKWTPEQIDAFVQKDPKLALQTLERIYDTTNEISNQWAEMGKAQEAAPEATVTPAATPAINFDALEDEHGKEMADALRLLAANQQAQPQATPQNTSSDAPEITAAFKQQVHTFFADPTLIEDDTFYGKGTDWEDLTFKQYDRRQRLLEHADALRDGAYKNHKELDNVTAMSLAHNSVAAEHIKAQVTADIKTTLEQRQANVDFVPTAPSSTPVAEVGGKKHEDGVVARTQAKLDKLFK